MNQGPKNHVAADAGKTVKVGDHHSHPHPECGPMPLQAGTKTKESYHESAKVLRYESLNVIIFRAFNLSCFRD